MRCSPIFLTTLLLAPLTLTTSCRSAYYSTMEAFGVHKREILVDRVEEGREAQQEAKEQFESALEAFRSVQDFDGGDLEKIYAKLNSEYEDAADRVEEVSERIESIDRVATDLFKEWESELANISNAELRHSDEQMLNDSRRRSDELLRAMRRAEERMRPVLKSFEDHVTYLKHNLNARAITSLQGSLAGIETDVSALIADMEASIAEADAFIAEMKT